MTDNEKAKLLEKIQKMLSKASNNPSEAEATMAANMVQELLARHNLTMSDVKAQDSSKDEPIVEDRTVITPSHPWRRSLGLWVAKLYFCEYMFVQQHGKNTHCFIGTQSNVTVATLMFQFFLTQIEKLAQQGSRSVPDKEKSPYRTSFRGAASIRLGQRIKERIEAAKKGTAENLSGGTNLPALLNLYDSATMNNKAWMSEKFPNLRTVSTHVKTNLHYKGNYDGQAAGNKIGLDQQVRGGGSKGLLR